MIDWEKIDRETRAEERRNRLYSWGSLLLASVILILALLFHVIS